MSDDRILELEGYITVPEAARRIGVTRQHVHSQARMMMIPGIRRVGENLLVPTEWVEWKLAGRPGQVAGQHPDVAAQAS